MAQTRSVSPFVAPHCEQADSSCSCLRRAEVDRPQSIRNRAVIARAQSAKAIAAPLRCASSS
jgi:hypothetical protein